MFECVTKLVWWFSFVQIIIIPIKYLTIFIYSMGTTFRSGKLYHCIVDGHCKSAVKNIYEKLIIFRELYLILNSSETIMSVEHYAATLVSHELAHKWFGNLITCFWWSNTWINEGFASYFGYIATHEVGC